MPSFNSAQLIDNLEHTVKQTIANATSLQQIDRDFLCKAAPGKWNVVQVLYHLNSYNDYYLPHIEQVMRKSVAPFSGTFKAGVIGNYFVNAMLPGSDGSVKNVMKAPKDHVADNGYTDLAAIQTFINGQNRLLGLLSEARKADMTKISVPISISRFIKIRLGDTFRFLIAHQQRHFVQINNTLRANGMTLSV
jgi:hypothetical protein